MNRRRSELHQFSLGLALRSANRVRASSRASRPYRAIPRCRLMIVQQPFADVRRRRDGSPACGGQASTRIRRMASAAAAKKWPRWSQCCPCHLRPAAGRLREPRRSVRSVCPGFSWASRCGSQHRAAHRRPAAAAGPTACGDRPLSMPFKSWGSFAHAAQYTRCTDHRHAKQARGFSATPPKNATRFRLLRLLPHIFPST